MQLPVLIVGGGIGGLATALALARHGRTSHVLEKAPAFGEIGAGLQLAPNATRMLDRLGILGEVSRCAVRPKFLVMRDARSARCITSLDLGPAFMRHFSYPYLVMHRGDLLEAELRAARTNRHITLECNREVVSIEDVGDQVRVVCGDGSVHEGVAVVGADGLRSVTRRVVHDDGDPLCAEAVAYRATVPFDRLPYDVDLDKMTIWVGPDLHFVQYVVRTGQLLNQVAVFRSREFRPGHDHLEDWGTPEELDEHFAGVCPQVRSGLGQINRNRRWAMFDRLPLASWTRNRVTLLGDAAHPMLQYAAQGACQALEDAVCLGECFAVHDDPHTAFLEYERRRRDRARRVQAIARTLGDVFHSDGDKAAERDALLAQRRPDDFGYFDWLYGYAD
jgi:salicylate hydroxylase